MAETWDLVGRNGKRGEVWWSGERGGEETDLKTESTVWLAFVICD